MFSKKNIIIILIFIVALLIGVWLIFFKNSKSNVADVDTEAQTRQAELNVLNQAMAEARKTDADQDGLSNEEEAKLGTDPNTGDSDHDGILDYDEINLYKSDPLKADTDGDGLKDGYEVLRGYSPTGSGKLEKNIY
ncbi:MAG: hypothetical protein A2538_03160 [Candidatus Magasanikbacteria bacterium RIFOXYD2_FULL_41_14]|uniref:EF-hand domain-containing protein n=1 Tax=Candidatus Magasanikbacteria bacterium RIFOXYD2_FULL_41_14 TaxID=1798709 RepID=A0A1F6PCF2_9BACT|nr:MAG: hypothetical protein A2538_03160 [Candidatus Magasanikbacteria bacterium RIFOXYD2_FULL_41_14]